MSDGGHEEIGGRWRLLSVGDRLAEIVAGIIITLSFTASLSIGTAGEAEVQTALYGALGCGVAWGIVDGVLYGSTTINVDLAVGPYSGDRSDSRRPSVASRLATKRLGRHSREAASGHDRRILLYCRMSGTVSRDFGATPPAGSPTRGVPRICAVTHHGGRPTKPDWRQSRRSRLRGDQIHLREKLQCCDCRRVTHNHC